MFKELDSYKSLPEAFFALAKKTPEALVYKYRENRAAEAGQTNTRIDLQRTYAEVSVRVKKIAGYLLSLGIKAGDKVAILSQSRAEWIEADFAITSTQAASVSVYQSLSAPEIAYILFDSQSEFVFAENQEQVDKLLEIINSEYDIPAVEDRPAQRVKLSIKKIIVFEDCNPHDLIIKFEEIIETKPVVDDLPYKNLLRTDLASLVYTSGTTGPPKGVVQTHGNHLANARQVWSSGILDRTESILIFLPLAHSFAKLMGNLTFCTSVVAYFPAIPNSKSSKLNPFSLAQDLRELNSNVIPIVPRLLEKMQSSICSKAKAKNISGLLLKATLWAARENYLAKAKGMSGTGILAQIVYSGTEALRNKIRAQLFGKNFQFLISGGAKLQPSVAEFFMSLDIGISEGYGLTETCVATNLNPIGKQKVGSVGPVLDADIELKLTEEKEICFRGPNIAIGYYRRPKATAESWDQDNWFHTGDLGSIDQDGYLSIVGRKKDIIVTSYGKNIAPDHIEGLIMASHYINQAVLVGNDRAYCIVLVTLDIPSLKNVLPNIDFKTDYAQNQSLIDFISKEIRERTKSLANYEIPKKMLILTQDLTVENGLLTPTFKVKKKLLLEAYSAQINELYSQGDE